jgi:hypothetical protein
MNEKAIGLKMSLSEIINHEAQAPMPEKVKFTSEPRSIKMDMIKVPKKRSWKKPKGKPKRPLSAYNLFFQRERNNLLTALPNVNHIDDYTINEHEKISKRRKAHGKIGFAELAQEIAKKWRSLDKSKRAIYEARALLKKKDIEKF